MERIDPSIELTKMFADKFRPSEPLDPEIVREARKRFIERGKEDRLKFKRMIARTPNLTRRGILNRR